MLPLPTGDLRRNLGTWAAPPELLPALGNWMHDILPNETYDPHARGQRLATTYFDTPHFDLRRARLGRDRYLTLRLRCYRDSQGAEAYALSAKTEERKWRQDVPGEAALAALNSSPGLLGLLPADLQARALELTGGADLLPVVRVCCRRYAVEDDTDRYTLDVGVRTDTGKRLPFSVLEFKSTDAGAAPPASLQALGLRPVKLSKFLWATDWR